MSTSLQQIETRKRRRRLAIGAGVGAVGLGLFLLLSNAKAEVPKPGGGKGGGKGAKGIKGIRGTGIGTGGSGGGNDNGGNEGPGGDLPKPGEDPLGPPPSSGGRANPKGGGKKPSRTNPGGGGKKPSRTNPSPNPEGPDPGLNDLPSYYNADWPDPGKLYQVGRQDADGLYGIAWRWFYTCLFLAARNSGGLSDEDARAWAAERVGAKGAAQAERADYLLCVAWNDVTYGSNTVAAKNRRGPHGRGIDLVPQHANNWQRIRDGRQVRRNVYLGEPGDVGTPRNAGQGDSRLPLLWMPRLDDAELWSSDGRVLKAAGRWADGSSFFFPPPVVMALGIHDATQSAGLGVWGCGDGQLSYESE